MIWTRSKALGLAMVSCAHCLGLGTRSGDRIRVKVCNCVFRAVFRACYAKFRIFSEDDAMRYVRRKGISFSRPRAEYCADFVTMARKTLDEPQYRLFRLHYLLGADWTLCAPKLGLDRGAFFHSVYRIQQKLGRAFAEVSPCALYPVDEYLGGVRGRKIHPLLVIEAPTEDIPDHATQCTTLRYPLKAAA